MFQFVEDLKEEQYNNFIKTKKLSQKRDTNQNYLYVGVAQDRKLIATCKILIQMENGKNIFVIPLGIQTILESEELYTFFQKYLLILAKKYNVLKIKLYSQENMFLLKIGYKKGKTEKQSYLPLKKEKTINIPSYFKVEEMNTERKRKKLKEVKQRNKDLFLFNNVSFFTLQLDLYTYLDTFQEEKQRKFIQEMMEELGDFLILESCSIEYLNDNKVQYIDYENHSSLLTEERKNILFSKLKEELLKKGIQKLFLPKDVHLSDLEQEYIIEYEYFIKNFSNFLSKRG